MAQPTLTQELYTVKDPQLDKKEQGKPSRRAELVEIYNNMEKDCFQETVTESAANKIRLATEILVAGNANNTKYFRRKI